MTKKQICVQLFTTEGCHLCEDALLLLRQAQAEFDFEISLVEISESEALVERYGVRIPVLKKNTSDAELDWPFDLAGLKAFIREAA